MTRDDYRYELPDFILGKSDPETAKAIERLIETDATFRVEFLEMKSLIEVSTPKLNRAFDAPTPAYFESLSEKVMAKLVPRKKSWWNVVKEEVALLVEVPRWQWAGGALATVLTLALIVLTAELDNHTRQTTLAKTSQDEDNPTLSLIATKKFAIGMTPEILATQLDEREAEEVLNILEHSVPTRKQTYKVLTDEEVESLFNPM
jgi:anti-sigma-K factor RskA